MSVVGVGLGRDARFLEEMGTSEDTRRLLSSNFVQEKLQGIKTIMGVQSLGKDVSNFFADVVKNVTVSNMELKKLVYMYLVQHAGDQPDLALLSVNSFQKDLSDPNQLIRVPPPDPLSFICAHAGNPPSHPPPPPLPRFQPLPP